MTAERLTLGGIRLLSVEDTTLDGVRDLSTPAHLQVFVGRLVGRDVEVHCLRAWGPRSC